MRSDSRGESDHADPGPFGTGAGFPCPTWKVEGQMLRPHGADAGDPDTRILSDEDIKRAVEEGKSKGHARIRQNGRNRERPWCASPSKRCAHQDPGARAGQGRCASMNLGRLHPKAIDHAKRRGPARTSQTTAMPVSSPIKA